MYDHRRQLGCPDDDDCVGGYRTVTAAYVDLHAPWTPPPIPEIPAPYENPRTPAEQAHNDGVARDLATNARHERETIARRDAIRHSSYPCPTCNPDQFLRWTDGDWPNPRRRTTHDNPRTGDPGPTWTGDDETPADFTEAITR